MARPYKIASPLGPGRALTLSCGWNTAGPPCAATIGAFSELGPFRTDGFTTTGKISLNPTRWSRNASLLFIEAPLGIGFSYSTSPSHDYAVDDHGMASTCLAALLAFYRKFPAFQPGLQNLGAEHGF